MQEAFGVIPAKAGTHEHDSRVERRQRLHLYLYGRSSWVPAFAGMTQDKMGKKMPSNHSLAKRIAGSRSRFMGR
jgi:hypothetical protein